MHRGCLIQSVSARKVTHIKLGTCSNGSQCQLHFGTKMVSIGWSGCEWLPSQCKNAHFQAFPQLTPSETLPLPNKQKGHERHKLLMPRSLRHRKSLHTILLRATGTIYSNHTRNSLQISELAGLHATALMKELKPTCNQIRSKNPHWLKIFPLSFLQTRCCVSLHPLGVPEKATSFPKPCQQYLHYLCSFSFLSKVCWLFCLQLSSSSACGSWLGVSYCSLACVVSCTAGGLLRSICLFHISSQLPVPLIRFGGQ